MRLHVPLSCDGAVPNLQKECTIYRQGGFITYILCVYTKLAAPLKLWNIFTKILPNVFRTDKIAFLKLFDTFWDLKYIFISNIVKKCGSQKYYNRI